MGSLKAAQDDRVAAILLQDLKAIATKEVELTGVRRTISFSALPSTTSAAPAPISVLLGEEESSEDDDDSSSISSSLEADEGIMSSSSSSAALTTINNNKLFSRRSRIVSIGSTLDMMGSPVPSLFPEVSSPSPSTTTKRRSSPLMSSSSKRKRPSILSSPSPHKKTQSFKSTNSSPSLLQHHDWAEDASSTDPAAADPLPSATLASLEQVLATGSRGRGGKRAKKEAFVGTCTANNTKVRATLRKKFSWKQFPELEAYLIENQSEYFEYSALNYTSEQRKYNNGLTQGLLDLAAQEGYVFEGFTFPMVRDRIRCYYKSHSQTAKKKKRGGRR